MLINSKGGEPEEKRKTRRGGTKKLVWLNSNADSSMSFLKRLFGLESSEQTSGDANASVAREVEHKGFLIKATPFKEGGQFQTCGTITKEVSGALKEHRFVRADRFAALGDAVEVSIRKGQQLIDEQGERLFDR